MPTGPALDKPVDVGDGTLCASFGPSGAWLSLGAPHPLHGFVELSGLPPFNEEWRGDPAATRRYRGWMTEERFAFVCLSLERHGTMTPLNVDLSDPLRPRWSGELGGVQLEAEAAVEPRHGVVQTWRLRGRGTVALEVRARLDRPALAEITEVDPPPPTGARSALHVQDGAIVVEAPALPATARITLDPAATWVVEEEVAKASVAFDRELVLRICGDLSRPSTSTSAETPRLEAALPRLALRALAYVRGCTALSVADGERAILTDHRILPLSWTRDAYYQALLLLATGDERDRRRVAEHLRWVWTRCERPDGRWVRSHHADGRRKDHAFQADQQLFPILELADYWRTTGSLPELRGANWTVLVEEAWRATLVECDETIGCLATVENAADDPAAAPYICASQILLWHAASQLADLSHDGALGLDGAELRRIASSLKQSVEQHFVVDGPFGAQWAYAVDGAGAAELYHDANDLPVALAPAWGFCGVDDPVWRATMRYAFSAHNPGFFAGVRCPGLGSLHTPGPWTLGDIQAWLFARLTGDEAAGEAALARLEAIAFADGMLPEAYAADDPSLRVRHWFAWPGAALAAFLLLDARGQLEIRLRAG